MIIIVIITTTISYYILIIILVTNSNNSFGFHYNIIVIIRFVSHFRSTRGRVLAPVAGREGAARRQGRT